MIPVHEASVKLDDIIVEREWYNMSNAVKVPSVYSYTKTDGGEKQWGNHFSPNAVMLIHTKLELDAQPSRFDELDLILHNLDGMHDLHFDQVERTNGNPDFTAKKPEIVIQDYMSKIFQRVMQRLNKIPPQLRRSLPVDIVITHPVVCVYEVLPGYCLNHARSGHTKRRMRHIALSSTRDSTQNRFQNFEE